jgi:hypothetical protein
LTAARAASPHRLEREGGRASQLCREHGTYVDLETLASAIHHVLQDDTEVLVKHLSVHRQTSSSECVKRMAGVRESPRVLCNLFFGGDPPTPEQRGGRSLLLPVVFTVVDSFLLSGILKE